MVCGCNNSIHKGLGEVNGVFGVRVEPERDRIVVEHTDEVDRNALVARLREMGYDPVESEREEQILRQEVRRTAINRVNKRVKRQQL